MAAASKAPSPRATDLWYSGGPLLNINFAQLFIGFIVLLFALTVHESAHAWMADRLGDPTGRRLGRVSLNPAVHADPVGTIIFPLIAAFTSLPIIGWAKPVPVDVRYLKNYRRDYLFIAIAGPGANLALAIISSVVLRSVSAAPSSLDGTALGWSAPVALIASRSLEINLLLAIFNMIPVPPLDGSAVLTGLLPGHLADFVDHLRPYGFLVLYALMLTGALSAVMLPPYRLLLSWLL
jgi:Zn-dependent protease